MAKINFKSLFFHLLVPIMISFIISMLLPDYKDFYENLNKPINVPQTTFPIVWTILYLLMGLSAYFVDNITPVTKEIKSSMLLYYVQLVLNFLWTPLFFGFNNLALAAIDAVLLFILVMFLIIKFYKIRKISGILLIPYLLWLAFASYLSVGIYFLNLG